MGGLIGGLYDLFAGNPTQKEQNQFGSLAGYQTGVGEGLTTAGATEEENILSGDPNKIAQVEAPEISAGQQQVQQQRQGNAEFGNRGGGTNASTQAAEAQERGNIINMTGNLIGSTAGAAVGQGTGLIAGASSDTSKEADLATQRRQQQVGDINGIAQGAAQIASGFMDPAAAAAPGMSAPQLPSFAPAQGAAFTPDFFGADYSPSADLSAFQ